MSEVKASRRQFLQGATALGLGGLLWGAGRARGQVGPNERIGIGLIGCGGMGNAHLGGLLGNRRVEVLALCDVDHGHLNGSLDRTQGRARGYLDHRELLAHDGLDAVCIATPDHWHATIAIDAMRAGLDVYCEKPMTHNVAEGRAMVDTARRLGRVVQLGTQQRSSEEFRTAVALIRSGRIGEVDRVRCFIKPRKLEPWGEVGQPPPELLYDRWLGPAPEVPYNPARVHYNWRYFWDYGGGLMSDWGVHHIDIVHWAMDQAKPTSIEAQGWLAPGSFQDVPEQLEVVYEYPGFTLHWSQQYNQTTDPDNRENGIWFHGSDGELSVWRGGYKTYPEDRHIPALGDADWPLPPRRSHWDDFLDCVITRERPLCDVATGHTSSVAAMLGNLAYRLGRKVACDGEAEQFVDDPAANRLLQRPAREPYTY